MDEEAAPQAAVSEHSPHAIRQVFEAPRPTWGDVYVFCRGEQWVEVVMRNLTEMLIEVSHQFQLTRKILELLNGTRREYS
jgi:hypothetical protein